MRGPHGLDDRRLFHLADDSWQSRNVAREHGDVVELAGLVEQSTGGSLPVYAQ